MLAMFTLILIFIHSTTNVPCASNVSLIDNVPRITDVFNACNVLYADNDPRTTNVLRASNFPCSIIVPHPHYKRSR